MYSVSCQWTCSQSRRYSTRVSMSDIASLCKRRGFIFPGSAIYGGFANSYDYGPLGAQLKKNVLDSWWKTFVVERRDCFGLDSSVLMSPKVWQASGHVDNFVDPMLECTKCDTRVRADKFLEEHGISNVADTLEGIWEQVQNVHLEGCPYGKESICSWSKPREFNLLFETSCGPVAAQQGEESNRAFFRPETAQGAYINFQHVYSTMRQRLPFGIGQVGKAFRNEISPGNYIFRTREFEQMELQWFCVEEEQERWYREWIKQCRAFLLETCGLDPTNLRVREHGPEELAHYSRATTDIEFAYPFGWGELWGISNRGVYDLQCHSRGSGIEMGFADIGNAKAGTIHPVVIEPALGLNRLVLAMLCNGYKEQALADGSKSRIVLSLKRDLAPVNIAVFPLIAKQQQQVDICDEIFRNVVKWGTCMIDTTGSIGKRYRRHDEIGTPYCITVDGETLNDNTVTVRDRDSMRQVRVKLDLFESKARLFEEIDKNLS